MWTKNGFGIGEDRNLSFFANYWLEGSQAKGEYHLRIANLTMSDEAVFRCSVSATNRSQLALSREARLTVLGLLLLFF